MFGSQICVIKPCKAAVLLAASACKDLRSVLCGQYHR